MKLSKFLISAAVPIAAISVSSAQAQSTTDAPSSVTLYGTLDAYVQAANGASTVTRLQSGGLSSSRLGFRGNEDLGGGLRAFFTLESGINVDDGTVGQSGVFWGRQAFVGIGSSGVGAVSLGRQYSSIYGLSNDFSEFGNVSAGASTSIIGGFGGYEPVRGTGSATGTSTGLGGPARVNNSVKLESASFGGFRAGALVGLGEVAGGTKGNRTADVYGRYTAGILDAMLSFVDDKSDVTALRVRTISGAAALTFGPARLTGGVIAVNDRSLVNADGQGAWVGGDYRIGSNLFKLQYVQSKNKGSLVDGKTQALGVGYQYDLSKRTSLYSSITRFRNEGDGSYTARWAGSMPTGLTTSTDRNINEFVAGIRHSF